MRKERGENFCVIVNVVTWDWPRSFCVLCLRLGVVRRKVNLRDGAAMQRTMFFFMIQFFIKDYSKHFPLVTAYSCTAHVWRISWNFCPYHVWTCGSRSHSIPHQFDFSCIDKLQSNVIFAHTCQLLGQFQMSIKICCCRRQFGRWVLERFKILSRWLFDCQSLALNVRNSQLGPRFIKLIWSGNK